MPLAEDYLIATLVCLIAAYAGLGMFLDSMKDGKWLAAIGAFLLGLCSFGALVACILKMASP